MGKLGGIKREANTPSKFKNAISLREEAIGKKQNRGSTNVKAILKHEHLQNLAAWASSEASIPFLASFFGHLLAADGEASAIPPDPSFFPCQRCETILQPGFKCKFCIEKNLAKARCRFKKPHILTQNSVVFNCLFCSHRNLKRGTPKGHLKEIYSSKLKASSIPKAVNSRLGRSAVTSSAKETKKDELNKVDAILSPASVAENATTLLDGKKRNRNQPCV